jgi:hypothetical protein
MHESVPPPLFPVHRPGRSSRPQHACYDDISLSLNRYGLVIGKTRKVQVIEMPAAAAKAQMPVAVTPKTYDFGRFI